MLNAWSIKYAADVVRSGGLIAYPTEGVWGLGCNPWDKAAVYRLLALKRRPVEKGLILIASNEAQIESLLRGLPNDARQSVLDSWPGPNTWLIPDPKNLIPSWVKGEHSAVAVRVTEHPIASSLCDAVGAPIISTSANPGGSEPALTKLKVNTYFGLELDFTVAGSLGGQSKPSTIRDAISGEIIRG